jgi:DNA-binding SARP family transcriptional activator/tetratricopeptide (TPR) repeat protein
MAVRARSGRAGTAAAVRPYGPGVEFRVLGPLEVCAGGTRVALGGPQAEKVLAALLIAGGTVVGVGGLVEALWDGEPPRTATHQVHKVVAGLRRRLSGVIETDGPGYRIRLDGAGYDLGAFDALVGTPSAEHLRAALALWRGPALAGIDSRALRAAADRLEERRLAAVEAEAELRLAAGEAAAVAVELSALVAAHPLRETLRCRLMVALYRCGRQADALAVYADARALLADELGVDPGPELARVHQQVLRADPALLPPAAGPSGVDALPYDLPDFAGRAGELERLLAPGTTAMVITAIDGMAGVGKTALAVHAAHRLAERYPDGRLFCDLHAHTAGALPVTAAAALERLLRMVGVPTGEIPDDVDGRAARWRAALAGRRMLVVLDNAASAAQVRPLLPGSPGCLVLVTSRCRLGVLDGAALLSLDVLPAREALDLFTAIAGADRTAAEAGAADVVDALGGSRPLAIRIAATRLLHRPQWTIAGLAARLRAERGRLAELTCSDRGVGSAFALSYAQLRPAQARLFRLLGLHPGADFDAYSAAALAGTTPARAAAVLETLVDAHLLRSGTAGRYSFHDLLRDYARDLAPDDPAAGRRLRDYLLAAATAATDLINPGPRPFLPDPSDPDLTRQQLPPLPDLDAALTWLTAEHATLVAVALADTGWQLACVLRPYFEHRGHFTDWRATAEHALSTTDSPLGTVLLHFGLGAQAMWTGRLTEGMEHFRRALAADRRDQEIAAAALTSLGMLAHLANRDREAARYLRRALATPGGDRYAALARNNLALAEARLGRGDAAVALHRQALAEARAAGSVPAVRAILLGLGETSLRLGLPAEQPFREALRLARAGRFRMQEALALDGLAHASGDPTHWRGALSILTDLRVTDRADLVRRHLADPAGRCCDLCRAAPAADAARPVPA